MNKRQRKKLSKGRPMAFRVVRERLKFGKKKARTIVKHLKQDGRRGDHRYRVSSLFLSAVFRDLGMKESS